MPTAHTPAQPANTSQVINVTATVVAEVKLDPTVLFLELLGVLMLGAGLALVLPFSYLLAVCAVVLYFAKPKKEKG